MKNLSLLAALSFLFVIYFVSKGCINARKSAELALFGIDIKSVNIVSIFNGTNRASVIIEKNDEGYLFNFPYKGLKADDGAVKKYFAILGKITVAKNIGHVDNNSLDGYGISARSPRVTLKSGMREETIVLGNKNPVAPQNYIYKGGPGQLCLIENTASAVFYVLPENFRNQRAVDIDSGVVAGIDINSKNNYIYRRDGKDWYVTEINSGQEYLCDKNKMDAFISVLTSLEVTDFKPCDENYSLARCGLDSPDVSIGIKTSSSTLKTITLGDQYGHDKIYFAVDDKVAGGTNASFADEILRPLAYFKRDKVIDFNMAGAIRFTSSDGETTADYEKKRGRWYKTLRRRFQFDEQKVQQFFTALDGLKIEKYFFGVPFGAVKKEYTFYNRKGEELLGLIIGETSDGYTKISFKNKKGVYGIATLPEELLEL